MDEATMRKQAARAKRWNLIIFWVFASLFAALLLAVCIFKYQHTFSKSKWDADREHRYEIVGDMLERNRLAGMSEAEVLQLLGPEDSNEQTSFKINQDYFPPKSTLVYYLGVDYMNCNWLVISLGDGEVVDYCLDVT